MTISTKQLYELDYNLWLETTAKLLRERRLDEIDYDNLIEDLEAMVRSDKNALASNLRILLMHLLKWEYQSQKRSNRWKYTIVEHCLRINKAFKTSPSLKRYFDDIFEESYQDAFKLASVETGMAKDEFPVECPFTKDDVLNSENRFTEDD
ncbi:protein of unknown function DUF29 [Gloeothece citriformis PCC 7424]|uniref:DUF29 domain-containing protein n=1 Tax=Gloeothece citriformis (strain PCC 7424) TaxID=65393 RepID=B7KJH7_GLOC7|nr:DUF29 domain-containing protein [Gloeothece citriformis]ACK73654.1 protein of unknown function DUF29 [Gloeothece citriformis PCC 7424]